MKSGTMSTDKAARRRILSREMKIARGTGSEQSRKRHITCGVQGGKCQACTDCVARRENFKNKVSLTSSSPSTSTATSSVSSTTPHNYLNISASPRTNVFATPQEHRSFVFFTHYTVPQVAGTLSFARKFWNISVLQASHHEAAVRHAAVALGSLHEKLAFHHSLSPSGDLVERGDDTFAVSQYVKALGKLVGATHGTGNDTRQGADMTLMTCILFICFETLRGHHGTAISHVDAGINILSELSSSSNTLSQSVYPYASLSILNRIFVRLETQATSYNFGQRRRLITSTYDLGPEGFEETIPQTFSSAEEAHNALEWVRTIGARALPRHPDNPPRTPFSSALEITKDSLSTELLRSVSLIKLRQWDEAFSSFLAKNPDLAQGTRHDILLLQIHKSLLDVSFQIDFQRLGNGNQEMVWDEFVAEYRAITRYATELITPTTACTSTSPIFHWEKDGGEGRKNNAPGMGIFNLEIGIITPLYLVAWKCREYGVRRKAIELLKMTDRQEGVSNSALTARVDERLVQIEEEGLVGRDKERGGPEYIPVEKRVTAVNVVFVGQERRVLVQFTVNKRHVVEEWIQW